MSCHFVMIAGGDYDSPASRNSIHVVDCQSFDKDMFSRRTFIIVKHVGTVIVTENLTFHLDVYIILRVQCRRGHLHIT